MKKQIHILHFKLNEKNRLKLVKIAKQYKKSLSATMVMIVEHLMPFIEKNHISFQDKKSRYKLITNNHEKRYSMLAYLPEEYYIKLKHMHHDLNVFSIAQIMRKIIEYFLKSIEKYGCERLKDMIKKIINKWEEKKGLYLNQDKEFTIQMFDRKPTSYLSVTYDLFSRPKIYKFV